MRSEEGDGRAQYRRRRSLRTAVGVGAVVLVLGAVVIAARGFGGEGAQQPVSSNLPPATAQVTRATLTQTERVTGTLGYGATTTVVARASAAATDTGTEGSGTEGSGTEGNGTSSDAGTSASASSTTNTVTWLSAVGSVVRGGQPLYKVDDLPVVLISGATPLYRVLADGVKGRDVMMLETNLRAFGYGGFTVDTAYTSATVAVVKRWQKKLGLEQTGTVDVNQVVVGPSELRVTEHKTAVGAEATGEVLAYTGTTRVVTVPLEVTRQHLVRKGLSATVTLPDGSTVTGTVQSIGTVASTGDDQQQPRGEPTVQVVVTVADQVALGALDAAPVQLTLVVAERKDVLTVPVGALVALAEGGYGVQVIEGSATRYLAVETGMFAGGKVEISGAGIAEGMTVGVPT